MSRSPVSVLLVAAACAALSWGCGGKRAPEGAAGTRTGAASSAPEAGGRVLVKDDFSDPTSGWERERDDSYRSDYANGAYEIVNSDTNLITRSMLAGREVRAGDVSVTARQTAGDPAIRFGLVLRYGDDGLVQAGITGDGQAFIGVARYEGYALTHRPQPAPFAAVRTGGEANRLRVVLQGKTATLYVNGKRFKEVDDVDINGTGLGLFSTSEKKPSRVVFDDFELRSLPE
jgi:hypothetical protein